MESEGAMRPNVIVWNFGSTHYPSLQYPIPARRTAAEPPSRSHQSPMSRLQVQRWTRSIFIIFVAACLCEPVVAQEPDASTAKRFVDHAANGNLAAVERALRTGTGPDVQGQGGRTALLAAVEERHVSVVRVLLDAGADLSVRSETGRTPLMVAAQAGHTAIVQGLLQNGADPSLETSSGEQAGWTALTYAAQAGQVTAVTQLLDAGPTPTIKPRTDARSCAWSTTRGAQIRTTRRPLGGGASFKRRRS